MKRKESIDKSKPNKDLANQLKARLFDKGTFLLRQASATARYLPSSDRSKTITIRYQLKITPLWSLWARINPIIESLRNNLPSSRSQQPNNTRKKKSKKFKCPPFAISRKRKEIDSAIWRWVVFPLQKEWGPILEIILESNCEPLKAHTASYQRLVSNFIGKQPNKTWSL